MIIRILVFWKIFDTRAEPLRARLLNLGLIGKNTKIEIADVYTIEKQFSDEELGNIALRLSNPVTQKYEIYVKKKGKISIINKDKFKTKSEKVSFEKAIEIGFLPGVTDNIATTAREGIEDLMKVKFGKDEGVYTSQLFFIEGKLNKKQVLQITDNLYNPLIQRAHVKDFKSYEKDGGMDFIIPKVVITETPGVSDVDLNVDDEELKVIGKSGIENSDGSRRGPLALSLEYMKTIQKYFKKVGRKPNDIELESLAQTWSEHCKHTIFADPIDEIKDGLFKTYIKGATEEIRKVKGKKDFCASVFTDNSGAIEFDENFLVTHKVETHNAPSALDPFGGAITGIVGVNRDTIGFGLGAKPVANFYGFCLSDPKKDVSLYRDKEKKKKMLSSKRILNGVVSGVNSGGNQSGIPTPQGFIYFDEGYRGKPLVFAGTVGLIPKKIKGKPSHIKKAMAGDLVVMIGGRVGKDGVHGATFSSESLDSGSPVTAVQLGDPITQKKFSDAIINEARDMLLYNSITDNGAGGLSCSVAEMAKESGGCTVDLEKVPLKYPHLEPWEIWISESQERMTLAVPKKNWGRFEKLMKRRGVEVSVMGEFTDSGKCVVKMNGKIIMNLDMDFLHDGLPSRPMRSRESRIKNQELRIGRPKSYEQILVNMLSRLNIASYEFISQQYDHIVLGSAVLGPLQGRGRVNGDASVFRPVLNSKRGVILSQAMYPQYSEIDTYKMAAASIDTAIRNAVAAGGNPDYLSLLDNFCWCSSDEPERLYQLKEAAKACYDFAIEFGTPYISGKDSMFNDFKGFDKNGKPIKISIPPTLLISSFGVVEDIEDAVSLDVKMPGDLVYVLGETHEEMGGSEYLKMMSEMDKKNYSSGVIPNVDAKKNKKLYDGFYKAIKKNLVASSISVRHGGLGMALARMAIGGKLGLDIDLKKLKGDVKRDDFVLFSESQGRIVATVAKENRDNFEKIMEGNFYRLVGRVKDNDKIVIDGVEGNEIINIELSKAVNEHRKTFKEY